MLDPASSGRSFPLMCPPSRPRGATRQSLLCTAFARFPLWTAAAKAGLDASALKLELFDNAAKLEALRARADIAAWLFASEANAAGFALIAANAAWLPCNADIAEPFNLPAIAAFATADAELNCCAAVTALANAEPYFAKFANAAWFFAMIAAAADVP